MEFEENLNHDEIRTFVDARYVSAPEAAWRLFEFPMHHQSHTIVCLAVVWKIVWAVTIKQLCMHILVHTSVILCVSRVWNRIPRYQYSVLSPP